MASSIITGKEKRWNEVDRYSCHLFTDEFQSDLDAVVIRAQAAGVTKMLLPNIDETTIHSLRSATANHPTCLYPMMGLHPTSVTKEWKQQLLTIRRELD